MCATGFTSKTIARDPAALRNGKPGEEYNIGGAMNEQSADR